MDILYLLHPLCYHFSSRSILWKQYHFLSAQQISKDTLIRFILPNDLFMFACIVATFITIQINFVLAKPYKKLCFPKLSLSYCLKSGNCQNCSQFNRTFHVVVWFWTRSIKLNKLGSMENHTNNYWSIQIIII